MAKLVTIRSEGSVYGYEFICPGCEAFAVAKNVPPIERLQATHVVPVVGKMVWGFNGDLERPTFSPSILCFENLHTDGRVAYPRCHSFVRDGRIEYQADCGHPLAGQTVELPEISEDH